MNARRGLRGDGGGPIECDELRPRVNIREGLAEAPPVHFKVVVPVITLSVLGHLGREAKMQMWGRKSEMSVREPGIRTCQQSRRRAFPVP